jgi:hypothetical protein
LWCPIIVPWELHPRSLVDDSHCAVSMLHTCSLKTKWIGGKKKQRRVYEEAMSEEKIKEELDKIFIDMGYKEGEYPFEGHWRTDGVTSDMVVEFCKQYNINCTCVNANNRPIAHHQAIGERKPRVEFFVRDDHCFWYGSEAKGTAANKASSTANALSQKHRCRGDLSLEDDAESGSDSPDNGIPILDEDGNFKQKEIHAFFASDKTPPMAEWKGFHDLLQRANETPTKPFESFREHATTNTEQINREKQKLYFYTTCCAFAEAGLRKLLKGVTEISEQFSIVPCYGASPDKVTLIIVKARGCPSMCIKEVPVDWELHQDMYAECARSLGLDPSKKILYKGEGKAQVCERMRVEIMKHYSRKPLSNVKRIGIESKFGGTCANCQSELEDGQWESDHISPLWQGGEDTVKNQEPLCFPCHDEKSEHERLYQGALKTIESTQQGCA